MGCIILKLNCIKIMILLGVLICIPAFSADTIKVFNANVKPIQTPFCVESITDFKPSSKQFKPYHERTMIWYQDHEHYRTVIIDFPSKGEQTYEVRSGNTAYMAICSGDHHEKWIATPVELSGETLSDLQTKREMRNPILLGIEEIDGIKVQHWRGNLTGKYSSKTDIIEVWMSIDKRIPIVLKSSTVNSRGSATSELVNLRVGKPIPDYILKPQINPSIGITDQLNSRQKPLWMIIIWSALDLLASVLLIYSIVGVTQIHKQIFLIAVSGFALLIDNRYPSGLSQHFNQYSGIPIVILIGLMTAIVIIYCLRKFPIPGEIKLLSGTRWSIIIWVIISLYLGFRAGMSQYIKYGLSSVNFSFLPLYLINIIIYYMLSAILQEVVFRGYLMGVLSQRFTSGRIVNIIQSIAFTTIHFPSMVYSGNSFLVIISRIIMLFIMGLIFGSFRLKYKNLGAPSLVHAAYNIGLNYGLTLVSYAAITNPLK